jgi:signal peptidase
VALGSSLLVLIALGLAPRLGFYRTVTVLSGSMTPTFARGDLIVVTPEPFRALRVGQVITYEIPIGDRHTETHRVIRLERAGRRPVVVTKGDANRSADPWRASLHGDTAWRYRFRIPFLGYAILALRAKFVYRAAVLLLPALLAVYALFKIWRTSGRSDRLRTSSRA